MEKASRPLYGWLAFCAFFGLTLSLILTALNIDPILIKDPTLFHEDSAPIRIVGFFSYFTIWSNIAVVYVGVAIALGKTGFKYFKTLFAAALLMITISGIVYNTVLLPTYPPKGWYWLTSMFMHLVAPVLFLYLWIKKGPYGLITKRNTLQILFIPIIYLIYTVAHGLAIKQWPYKFLDLTSEGFMLWIVGVVIIFGFGIFLIFRAAHLDVRLAAKAGQDRSGSAL